jgi:hypothetical protein
MRHFSPYEAWYGRDEPPPVIQKIRAGDVEVEFQDGDLRYIRYAEQELIRRIYVAIRDVNWNTIPARISNLVSDIAQDHFRIQFDAFHQDGPLAFGWHATLEGLPDGTIEYVLEGQAESDFRYCRIGFCVLHPIAGVAGRPFQASLPGEAVAGVLPELIEPQRIENGFEVPLFPACSSLAIELTGGVKVITQFEGDLFEMEDQRNWSDGSFKTYCTPLSLGYPHQARAGQIFQQKVTVRVAGPSGALPWGRTAPGISGHTPTRPDLAGDPQILDVVIDEAAGLRLPSIGFGSGSHDDPLTPEQVALLARLKPAHLKCELHLPEAGWPQALSAAQDLARQTRSGLELAIFLGDEPQAALESLAAQLPGVPVARAIIFHEAEAPNGTTSPRWMDLARQYLGEVLQGSRLVGGTNGNFAELNRQRPDPATMQGLAYTLNPQVHSWDERSLIEALEAQRDTVLTARQACGQLPVSVSSVTLKPPFNQAATEAEALPVPDGLPASVDPRQMSLFAASWTVGSLRSLAAGGADSVTYYEASGWRGLMETPQGSPLPDKFCSFPGMVFPVYYVFEFLAGAQGCTLHQLQAERPLLVEGLAIQQDKRFKLVVSNLQPYPQKVRLSSLPQGEAYLRRLNENAMAIAATGPESFLNLVEPHKTQSGETILTLKAYATIFLEIRVG